MLCACIHECVFCVWACVLVLMYSIWVGKCMSGCMSLVNRCRDLNGPAIQYMCIYTHTHVSVWDISLAQDMAGVQGQHRGHALESSHSHRCAAPQSLKLASFLAALTSLSEVIWEERTAFYLKPAEWKWLWLDNDTHKIRQAKGGGGAAIKFQKNPVRQNGGGGCDDKQTQQWNEEAFTQNTRKTRQVSGLEWKCPVAVQDFGFKETEHHHVADGLYYMKVILCDKEWMPNIACNSWKSNRARTSASTSCPVCLCDLGLSFLFVFSVQIISSFLLNTLQNHHEIPQKNVLHTP